MKKIHDSKILNYRIDFEYSKVEIKAVSEQEIPVKILFEDFFAVHFEDQLPDSILLDIVEGEIEAFAIENKELLDQRKDYYWPMDYDDIEELINFIKKNGFRYYKIQASYGLNGWILSKRMLIVE
ncbi:hypothetical protein ACH95_07825 [Bacillus glycinifermentans]|uniref:hypothetical protein n=1 Tax=Bacillus glycinifermentans TaxID=1664069 RepID=UPI000652F219|nr:hypothetical protein [Bacillus glycinifermentans]KMM61124.1 hypothetical protein ACH95_07825 [Bacillus glycinifermentans]MEC0495975.1 hypothetical protein [Bacillus glycinifermentans]MEC0539094.1 hypothetical protein [Bacillus glycinifermentans]